jgi:hypothetical protein
MSFRQNEKRAQGPFFWLVLLPNTQFCNQLFVSLGIRSLFKIIQVATTPTNQNLQASLASEVFSVLFQMLSQFADTFGEHRHLHLGAAGIVGADGVFFGDVFFLFGSQGHIRFIAF